MPNGVVIVVAGDDKSGEVFAAVQKHMAQTATAGREMGSTVTKSMRDMQESITLMRDAFVLNRVYDAIKGMIERTVDLGMELGHLSAQTGISVENLSVLRYASQVTGIEFDTLTKGFKKLSLDMFEWQHGAKAASYAFTDLGLSAKDVTAASGDMWKVLGLVADRFQKMPDGAHKSAIATELLGRSGQQLIPVLNQGAAGIERYRGEAEKLGIVVDQATVAKMEELHAAMVKVQMVVEAGSLAFSEGLGKALEGIADAFAQATEGSNIWFEAGKNTGALAAGIAGAFQILAMEIRETKDELTNWEAAGSYIQSGLDMHLDIGEDARLRAYNKHEEARAAMHDSKMDHDAAEQEERDFNQKMIDLQKELLNATMPKPGAPSDGLKGIMSGGGFDLTGTKGVRDGGATAIESAQKRARESQAQLAEAADKLEETRAKAHAQTMLEINQELYSQGLRSEGDYLDQKQQYQTAEYKAEADGLISKRKTLQDQIAALEAKPAATAKERAQIETQVNTLKREELGIDGQLVELDERRAKAVREMQYAYKAMVSKPIDTSALAGPQSFPDIFKAQTPSVVLGKQPMFDPAAVQGASEKFAHAIFDPLFSLNEQWNQQWNQMRAGLLRGLGQLAESQLFSAFFGDPQGRGGRGLSGTSWQGNTTNPRTGLQGNAGGLLGGLLNSFTKKHASVASNGGLGSGAGTVPTAAASLMQMGKKDGAGAGGIQVVLNNNGVPLQGSQTQQQNDGGEGQVIQIMLKQLETNGPVAQGIMGLVGGL